MANATTHPTDKVLKMIGGLYGKWKGREDWAGGIGGRVKKRTLYIYSVILQVATSLIKKFRMWEEV